ncbi:acetyl-coenzyme A carboxylase carboxyl transferase subunit alpha, chloroplastic-like isoform X1 [Syzygium oleosum]|uniref:acetyl-coenzyme A carboxylase carboxyl transferase subunit alpha, chloroplastic-like isoform X1 n=2 Tax=Syzygium oleosum TaxID=219896 RepID=UPI0024B87814|nr:acetyl-coenzyme A carboxylase carboxyl transferase subunit alpha, chloroplastic-like isoform X1 [Syzygium oleosum]
MHRKHSTNSMSDRPRVPTLEMNSLSLLGRNGGGQQRGNFQGFEFGSCSNATKELSASDLLRSSSRGSYKYWSKLSRGSRKQYRYCIFAKVNKGRKHEYPWPDNLDPNIPSEQQLTYLSHFKPLAEKPKPVTLPFEKPLMDLEQKIVEVQRMADKTGLDFSDQIGALENKYQQVKFQNYHVRCPRQG